MTQQGGRDDDGGVDSTREASTGGPTPPPVSRRRIGFGLLGALAGAVVVALLVLGGVAALGGHDDPATSAEPTASVEPTASASDRAGGEAADPPPQPSEAEEMTAPAPGESSPEQAGRPVTSEAPRPWSASEAAPDGGTYAGVVTQRGSQRPDTDYSVIMTFTSAGSYVDYSTLGCTGTLRPTGDVDGARVYQETITSGPCDQGGTWYVTRQDATTVTAVRRPAAGDDVVEGQLTR